MGGEITHDFSFALIENCRYLEWFHYSSCFKCLLTDANLIKGCVPIGSVEFVIEYLQKYYNKTPKPRNVPMELLPEEFSGRNIFNGTEDDIKGLAFVKSNDRIKGFVSICDEVPTGNYQISDVIDIDSEWRGFVYKRELVGLQNYSGEFTIFPDVVKILNMIEAYTDAPVAYTLDVGITKRNTIVIEVHDFFSCGLYGFCDKNLAFMFRDWFSEYTYNMRGSDEKES